MDEKRYYSPGEVGGMLNVSTSTVLRLIHEGRLPALRVSERIYRIPRPAFERFQAGENAPAVRVAQRRVNEIPSLGRDEKAPRSSRLTAPPR